MTKLGYQIPNFTHPDTGSGDLIDIIVAQAKEAEASGFDRVTVMDHFYQLPVLGQYDEPMIEAYSLLAAIAQHTEKVRLATLVTGNTYRNPAMLAKTITALDVVSKGRATLGIGAGWYEEEHEAMGYEFGSFTDRFERLEEALQIIIPLLKGETSTFSGERYTTKEFVNSPPPVGKIPLMVGGSGEKKTLRMVAQYADESNLVGISNPGDVAGKLEALEAHCERLGRDRSEITVTMLLAGNIAPTMEEADQTLRDMIALKGWPAEMFDLVAPMLVHGDPDTVGARVEEFMATGIDGVLISNTAGAHIPGRVTLMGETLSKVVG